MTEADDKQRLDEAMALVDQVRNSLMDVRHERVPGAVQEAIGLLVEAKKLLQYAHMGKPGGGPWPWKRL